MHQNAESARKERPVVVYARSLLARGTEREHRRPRSHRRRLNQIVNVLDVYDPRLDVIGRVARRFEADAKEVTVTEAQVAENLLLGRTCDTCAFVRRTSRVQDRRMVLVAEWCGGTAGRRLPESRTCEGWRGCC